jgi:predicted nucleic acid-binding protein
VNIAVVDACVALSWVMPDEHGGPEADILLAHQERRLGLLAPSVWEYEVANALRSAVMRGRVAQDFGYESLATLLGMGIAFTGFADLARRAWELALSGALTIYDASYVALAETRRCDLYTCDEQLANAARGLVSVQLLRA